jgi:Domain of unknown function (DUF1893)
MFVDKLPDGITMQLYLLGDDSKGSPGKILFSSSKKWLHPLFELEEFLALHAKKENTFEFEDGITASSADLFLRDRIIGRAAVFLIVRMGIIKVESELVSRRALSLLNENSVPIETVETIDAIKCITEELLKDILTSDEVYSILSERRGNLENNISLIL